MRSAAFSLFFLAVFFLNSVNAESVWDMLMKLGEPAPEHHIEYDIDMVKQGYDLVHKGYARTVQGKKTPQQSEYFLCTDCHNTVREDPDLSVNDPVARLEYLSEEDIALLPALSFYGAVNRNHYYLGYEKKYGDAVNEANQSLRASIDLCATACAAGRPLETWEREAILAYFWTLEYKMEDLNLSEEEKQLVSQGLKGQKSWEGVDFNVEARKMIQSKYLAGPTATFSQPPEDRDNGYQIGEDARNGEKIFTQSCLSCHTPGGVVGFPANFRKNWFTFWFLDAFKDAKGKLSYFTAVREGIHAEGEHEGKYMPAYPIERISDKQLDELRMYIRQSRRNIYGEE